jgi:hypothetical protein
MKRRLLMGLALAAVLGCQLPPDQEPLRPLREHGPRLRYDELVSRARRQADLALEASYINNWGDLEDLAKALEQTTHFLPTAPQAPDVKKNEQFRKLSGELSRDAAKLTVAARAMPTLTGAEKDKKLKEIEGLLLSISKTVRQLGPSRE